MLDFNTDIIRKNKIELLDCQVELVLRSLELYAHTYKYIYPRHTKFQSKEEDLRISLVTDTYEQIINEFADSMAENPVYADEFRDHGKYFKKIA